MEQLTLKPRKIAAEEVIENWDDDDLEIGGDDFTCRSASVANTGPYNRDSISSRLSLRSELDSIHGDEEKHVHLPGDDERATTDAIATATRAGIPIPANVPSSALLGGTIKRLGGRKIKKFIQDDWDDGDLELPREGALKIKHRDGSQFPDALRHVSGPNSLHDSPARELEPSPKFDTSPTHSLKPKVASSNLILDRFRDMDDDDFFGDGGATIKISKQRAIPKLIPIPPTPQRHQDGDDDFEKDLQFPSTSEPLRLSTKREIPKTPISMQDEFDEWGEGSLGTRFGGTRRDARSNRSSSVSALSPSASSSLTVESEDEGLDGLVLPSGPLSFDDILKKKQQERFPDFEDKQQPAKVTKDETAPSQDDFLAGLEVGEGEVFDAAKLSLHRNVKVKSTRQGSPGRPKTAVSLVFTNKPSPTRQSRLPRPLGHERTASALEPVSETGGPVTNLNRRSQSRLAGHSAHSSISSIVTPTTSSHSMSPSPPIRRGLNPKLSANTLRNEPTTTSAQLLKLKRSLPVLGPNPQSPAKSFGQRYERPPSRTESNSRPNSMSSRPKTPSDRDRSGSESSVSHPRKHPAPFLPAGSSSAQSHHVAVKTSRHFRRHDSESSLNLNLRPSSRTVSRSAIRSPSPRRNSKGAEALAREVATKRQITKPVRRRHFGDGCELDGFDDLPTSQQAEQKYMKQPVGRGAPKSTLRRVSQSIHPDRTVSPMPTTPLFSQNDVPRFARDTNASRMAREHALSHRVASSSGPPLNTLASQLRAQAATKTGSQTLGSLTKSKKNLPRSQKPQLIKPLGNLNNPKSVKGMYYNPVTFRWEGNEDDLTPFDPPAPSPTSTPMPPSIPREKENTTPRPALITNINSSQNVQIVGGMVFDPHRMCWLKVPSQSTKSKSDAGDTMDGFDAFDDEEDVFKDVPDLEDSPSKEDDGTGGTSGRKSEGLKDEWLVGEEFDVGPEFVRRQREEEERWRRKCEKWVGRVRGEDDGGWRWSIRDVVGEQV
ncbi:hypothetical protein F5884DRAFT_54898 [Xylogone sp. PMI_703]|nr:hypothetical protein F5884DRAFT_54898 [Xylogone sp. PMI_703]